MQRRGVLLGGAAVLGGALATGWWLGGTKDSPLVLSSRNDSQGRSWAVGYRLDGRAVFNTAVGHRCHDIGLHPFQPLAVFLGRRPSRESYLLDTRDGRLLQVIRTPEDRHFYGHGLFHHTGEWFYTTENDTRDPGRGLIGIYRLQQQRLTREGELPTQGIGPHQLLWMPDRETLAIANGGIRTEADSRVKMNLERMEPSLVLMHRDGRLISQERLADTQNSIRHLARAQDGTLVSGQQYEGDPMDSVPLLAIKRPGQAFQAFPIAEAQRQQMQQYTASLAIHDGLRQLAVTAPRGNRFFIWDLDSAQLLLEAPLSDCAGVGAVAEGFVVSAGQGRCRLFDSRRPTQITAQPLLLPEGLWDNHLRVG